MNRTSAVASLLLLTAALFPCAAEGSNDATRAAIEQLEHDLNAAVLARDRAALERLLADDYASGGRVVYTKAERIDLIMSVIPPKTRTVDEMSVRLYGGSAVVTGLARSEWLSPQGAGSETFRWVNVWVRGEYGWQVVHGQTTVVGSSSSEDGC